MTDTLLVATRNAHKTEEIRAMLGDRFAEVVDLESFPGTSSPEETGDTFAENSAIKALAASREKPEALVLADDSGLEVDALDGAPGIRSARYSGEDATDADNRAKLLAELAKPPHAGRPRTARFRCVVTVARGGEALARFDGTVEGRIAETPTGDAGFGYDPVFVPEGFEKSFAELPGEVKNSLSHRGRAMERFRAWLDETEV